MEYPADYNSITHSRLLCNSCIYKWSFIRNVQYLCRPNESGITDFVMYSKKVHKKPLNYSHENACN